MVDPKKMQAWAQGGGDNKGPLPPPKPQGGGGGGDEGEEGEGGAEAEDLIEKFGAVLEELEHNAEAIEEQVDMLDADMLTEPDADMDDEMRGVFEDAIAALPESVPEAVREHLKDASWSDCQDIAEHLEGEGKVHDAELFGGFIYHLAHMANDGNPIEGAGEEPDGSEVIDIDGG